MSRARPGVPAPEAASDPEAVPAPVVVPAPEVVSNPEAASIPDPDCPGSTAADPPADQVSAPGRSRPERWQRVVEWLDSRSRSRVGELVAPCCGSRRFREGLLDTRPWITVDGLLRSLEIAFDALARDDWLEAFAAHPRVGDRRALRSRFGPRAGAWSQGEQEGMDGASEGLLVRLEEGNRRYEEKFGHVFLICATGLDAERMLHFLERRLPNDAETELGVAAAEERRIVRIRMEKLLDQLVAGDAL
ncbi:MAG: 2-oxo-4-hydroxy-4-carboxy-5-ureidoimidazoline decarboxylase [Holophagales bacterium]|nr:2-oxo-4-hydroxy-4-carboxy-5-ureidoimidazoline decarboxylase [Holophagales bacterium]